MPYRASPTGAVFWLVRYMHPFSDPTERRRRWRRHSVGRSFETTTTNNNQERNDCCCYAFSSCFLTAATANRTLLLRRSARFQNQESFCYCCWSILVSSCPFSISLFERRKNNNNTAFVLLMLFMGRTLPLQYSNNDVMSQERKSQPKTIPSSKRRPYPGNMILDGDLTSLWPQAAGPSRPPVFGQEARWERCGRVGVTHLVGRFSTVAAVTSFLSSLSSVWAWWSVRSQQTINRQSSNLSVPYVPSPSRPTQHAAVIVTYGQYKKWLVSYRRAE
jgi:hypothetical protein